MTLIEARSPARALIGRRRKTGVAALPSHTARAMVAKLSSASTMPRADCCSEGFRLRGVGKVPELETETVSDYNPETVSGFFRSEVASPVYPTWTAMTLIKNAAGTGRTLRADARRNRKVILKIATRSFAAHGVNVSLDEIAREAGVGPGTLYRHFPTRDHLLCSVLQERTESLLSRVDEISAMPCAGSALRAWMIELKDYFSAFHGLPQPFIDAFKAQASPLKDSCHKLVSITGGVLSRAQAEGAAKPSVHAPALFLSALGAALVNGRADEYGTTPELIQEVLTFGYLTENASTGTAQSRTQEHQHD